MSVCATVMAELTLKVTCISMTPFWSGKYVNAGPHGQRSDQSCMHSTGLQLPRSGMS